MEQAVEKDRSISENMAGKADTILESLSDSNEECELDQPRPNRSLDSNTFEEELNNMSVESLRILCMQQKQTIKQQREMLTKMQAIENRFKDAQANFENKLKLQQLESSRKVNILLMKLTLKEQDLQECLTQIEALKQARLPTSTQLTSYLLDPALNYMFEKMAKEVNAAKARVEEMQSELNAWKFTADSVTGKRLMAKCRQLHQENEELGKMISSGKIAKLEGGLAMHKNYSEELKKSQSEIEEVLIEMEEDIEGFQNTVYCLQKQLKEQQEKCCQLEESIAKCKNHTPMDQNSLSEPSPVFVTDTHMQDSNTGDSIDSNEQETNLNLVPDQSKEVVTTTSVDT